MERVYRNFYRNFYLKTGGFIPSAPINQNVYPGDFFQIRNGEMIVLGNIFRNGIIAAHDVELSNGIKLNPAGWNFGDGVTKPYSGRGNGHGPLDGDFEYSKQILAFAAEGSFIFRGNDPESVKINNWTDIAQSLIIKLTQTIYSFRNIYVVTECATTSSWTLAIASSHNGELEIATDAENFGLVDIFGHASVKTIQSKDIEYYNREDKRKPSFFKARKLVVLEEKLDTFISELLYHRQNQHDWARDFYDYDFNYDTQYNSQLPVGTRASVLDMLQANELNPTTALNYFRWADAGLDDVENMFVDYGN
jgi:hypothetical protein